MKPKQTIVDILKDFDQKRREESEPAPRGLPNPLSRKGTSMEAKLDAILTLLEYLVQREQEREKRDDELKLVQEMREISGMMFSDTAIEFARQQRVDFQQLQQSSPHWRSQHPNHP